jgi:YidC/Oxa1 family membrane protein insertase
MVVSFFYNIIIAPIYDILEFFFVFFSSVTSKGMAVIALSFVVTLFCLPLYIVAESWQEKERQTQKQLKPGIDRIKKSFKGDEQYMILSTFYKQHHYHPIMALRSSFSLLIQIPFFIAAYMFLSQVESLKGYSFLFIRDMGAPDAMFHIGSFPVNLLPVAMTLINCISGAVYSHGHDAKEKIQIYACAAVFLVLLYTSPAGLVLYWTMNNVLSMVKNVFFKMRNPKKVFHIVCCAVLFCAVLWAFRTGKKVYIAGTTVLLIIVLLWNSIASAGGNFLERRFIRLDQNRKLRDTLFFASASAIALLAGAVIPSFIIESSPADFCYVENNTSPFVFIITPLLQSIGLFLFWPACLYGLFSRKVKKVFALAVPVLFIAAVVNCFVFSGDYGMVNNDLTFMHEVVFPKAGEIIINLICMILIASAVLVVIEKKAEIMNYAALILIISLGAVSVKNVLSIQKNYSRMNHDTASSVQPVFHLSKTRKNVIVIMQDMCLSPVIHEVFQESQEMRKSYEGFTFYPNTVSMSYYTQLGVPGVFGGYDFTPWEINRRTDQTIQRKHNEAVLTMPTVFSRSGYEVTVSDIPYENYGEEPVQTMYKSIPSLRREVTKGVYTDIWYGRHDIKPYPILTMLLKRNFLYMSIFKTVMPVFRPMVYHREWWIVDNDRMQDRRFMDCYAPLSMMSELTSSDADKSQFLLLDNEVTHEPIFLQAPDYVPVQNVTDKGTSPYRDTTTYHGVACAIHRWSDFFEYLKKKDVTTTRVSSSFPITDADAIRENFR